MNVWVARILVASVTSIVVSTVLIDTRSDVAVRNAKKANAVTRQILMDDMTFLCSPPAPDPRPDLLHAQCETAHDIYDTWEHLH